MSDTKPSSVTIEEAVARMVNLKYLHVGYSLVEIMGAFLENAEVEYENAAIDKSTQQEIQRLEVRCEVCRSRHNLVQQMLNQIKLECRDIDSSILVLADDSTNMDRLTLASVEEWASENFGIDLPEWQPVVDKPKVPEGAKWQDINIKIYKNFTLSIFYKNQPVPVLMKKHFREIGMMGVKAKEPNWMGKILLIMSIVKKFPPDGYRGRLRKKELSGLRKILQKLVPIGEDPFHPYENFGHWEPKFKIIDDQRNMDKRLKDEAKSKADNSNDKKGIAELRSERKSSTIEHNGERYKINYATGELEFEDDADADDFEWKDDAAQRFLDQHDNEK